MEYISHKNYHRQKKENLYPFAEEKYQLANIEKDCLNFENYTLKNFEKKICILTRTLEEIITILKENTPDYWSNTKSYQQCFLILECFYLNIKQEKLYKMLIDLEQQYKLHVVFCDNSKGVEYQTYTLLERYLFNEQERLQKALLHKI